MMQPGYIIAIIAIITIFIIAIYILSFDTKSSNDVVSPPDLVPVVHMLMKINNDNTGILLIILHDTIAKKTTVSIC